MAKKTDIRTRGVVLPSILHVAAAAALLSSGPAVFAQDSSKLQAVAVSSNPMQVYEIFTVHSSEPVGGNVAQIDMPALSLTGSSLLPALELALADKGLSATIRTPIADDKKTAAVRGVRGNLEQVMGQLSQSLDFFWAAKDGVLTIDGTRTFSLALPTALAAERASIEKSLVTSGATEVRSLALDNIIIFRASPSALASVKQVLDASALKRGFAPVALQFGNPVAKTAPAPVARTTPPAATAAVAGAPISATPAAATTGASVATPPPTPLSALAAAAPAASQVPQASASPSAPVATAQSAVSTSIPALAKPAAIVQRRPSVTALAQAGGDVSEQSAQAESPRFWGINVTDRTVEGVLRRWASENGWSLRYEFDRIPVLRPASVIATDFIGAAKQIQQQLVEAGYAMDLASIGTTLRVSPGGSK